MNISGSPALSFFFEGKQKKEVGEGGTGRVEGGQVTERRLWLLLGRAGAHFSLPPSWEARVCHEEHAMVFSSSLVQSFKNWK